jgi:hypothetical protein
LGFRAEENSPETVLHGDGWSAKGEWRRGGGEALIHDEVPRGAVVLGESETRPEGGQSGPSMVEHPAVGEELSDGAWGRVLAAGQIWPVTIVK